MKILILDYGMPFNIDTPYTEPLGGSETSILLLAKGLSELGHSTVLLNNTHKSYNNNNLIIDSNTLAKDIIQDSDVILLNRFIPQGIEQFKGRLYYYSHDAYDQQHAQWMLNKDIVNFFNKIFCVSEWQKNSFIRYFGVDTQVLDVLPNPLDYSLYYGYTPRNNNKLIFASIPYKGLDIIPDIFSDLCIKSKRDDLELYVYSSMKLYGNNEDDIKQYGETFTRLNKMKNVYVKDPISMKDLASELMSSSIYLHPHMYHETFGMVFNQSMAAGCIPVTTNKGASREVIPEEVKMTSPNLENINTYNSYIELLRYYLDQDNYKLRLSLQDYAKKYDYIKIAQLFCSLL